MSGMDVSDSALLATLLREAPIGFAFFGTDLCFRRVNRSLARLHGRNGADHLGMLPSQIWPEQLASRAESAIRRVLADDQPLYEPDQPIAVAAGTRPGATAGKQNGGADPAAQPQVRHWAFSWFPAHDPEGGISGVALIAVDVTERRNSEEAVRRSEERYRSLVQAGAQVVWVTTPTGEIAEDSPEWRSITGQSLQEYLGNGWLDAVHSEDRERVERDWQDHRVGGREHRCDRPARGRGDARSAHRAAVRGGAAHGAAAAGHLDAGRGAHRGAGGRGDHRGGPVGHWCRPLGGGAA
jgi:PAS domain S-box-containing protein